MSGALLAFELAGAQCSVAVRRTDGATHERAFPAAGGRGLLAEMDELLAASDVTRADLRGVIAGVGPGSYTGLRIACAAARALGAGLGIPAGGVISFEAAALAAPPGVVHLLLDAFRGEIYHAAYERCGDDLRVLVPPRVLTPAAAAAAVPAGARVIGDARFAPACAPLIDLAAAPRAALLLQRAAQLGAQPDGTGIERLAPLEPLYLRPAAFPPARR